MNLSAPSVAIQNLTRPETSAMCTSIECYACGFVGTEEDFQPRSDEAANAALPECPECESILAGEDYEGIF